MSCAWIPLLARPPDGLRCGMVRAEGLEPPHLSTTGPKPAASTSSATRAGRPKVRRPIARLRQGASHGSQTSIPPWRKMGNCVACGAFRTAKGESPCKIRIPAPASCRHFPTNQASRPYPRPRSPRRHHSRHSPASQLRHRRKSVRPVPISTRLPRPNRALSRPARRFHPSASVSSGPSWQSLRNR